MKIGIFADVSSLYTCVRKKYNNKLEYYKLFEFIQDNVNGEVKENFAFGSRTGSESDKFIRALEGIGFCVKYKRRKKGKFLSLSTEIFKSVIEHIKDLDVFVICSSNRDLEPVVEYLLNNEKQVIIIGCGIPTQLTNMCPSLEIGEELLEAAEVKE